MNCDSVRRFPELFCCCCWGGGEIKEHPVCNLIQKDFTYSGGKWGRRGTKEEREKARARQRKREKTRVREGGREKKERKKD